MISCTDFIPAYSELFTFLEERYGRASIDEFWEYLFDPNVRSPLAVFLQKEGIRGCFSYWTITLNEEAADFTMYLNEKAGWFLLKMHHCPSKGRLLELQGKTGLVPYRDYCLHCDHYREAVEQAGLSYIFNFCGMEKAACSIFVYDSKVFDGRIIVDENTEIMDRKAADNEYLHWDFHYSMNNGVEYVATRYGENVMRDYLATYTRHLYGKLMEEIRQEGLAPLKEMILSTYQKEHAQDAVEISCDQNAIQVHVKYCPGVRHMRKTGKAVSKWYSCTTQCVMDTIAKETGYHFTMEHYDEETGAADYRLAR